MELACPACHAPLHRAADLVCERCNHRWPVIGDIPLLVNDVRSFARGTFARFLNDRGRAFAPLQQAIDRLAAGRLAAGHLAPAERVAHLERITSGVRSNYALFEECVEPLLALTGADAAPLEDKDLEEPVGYGPEAATFFLLRDWRPDTEEALEWAADVLPFRRRRRAVVLGSGAGRTVAMLSSLCDEVIGIELSYLLGRLSSEILRGRNVSMHEICLNNVRRAADAVTPYTLASNASIANAQMVVGDATRAPLPSGAADWVVCSLLYDILGDGQQLLREMRRILAPDGRALLVTVFNYDHGDLLTYHPPEHLLAQLDAEGLRVEDALWVRHSHLYSPKSIKTSSYSALRVLVSAA